MLRILKFRLPLMGGVVFSKSAIFLFLISGFCFLIPDNAHAQALSLDLGHLDTGGSAAGKMIQIILLVTLVSLAPSILVMVTSFTRIIVVLSFLRSAIGLQTTPPNAVLVSLALFLTLFIMMPVFQKSYTDGFVPLMEDKLDTMDAVQKMAQPFQTFMLQHVRSKDLQLFIDMDKTVKVKKPEDTPYRVLIPAFMISELKRSFEIGFLIFIPFLIIDMLVASILMSMGMMMLPPVLISLPFKLIFFVLTDGWYMLAGSLVRSFGG